MNVLIHLFFNYCWTDYRKNKTKMVNRLESPSCEERLSELGLLSWRRLHGISLMSVNPQGKMARGQSQALSVVPSARTSGHGHKLEHIWIPLNKIHFCAVQVMEFWHRKQSIPEATIKCRRTAKETEVLLQYQAKHLPAAKSSLI